MPLCIFRTPDAETILLYTYTADSAFYHDLKAHQLNDLLMIYMLAVKTMRKSTIRTCQPLLHLRCTVAWPLRIGPKKET